jgi:hypothetical protein
MTMQGPDTQSFDGLSNDLIIRYFRSLGFQLQKPSEEIGQCFFSYWAQDKKSSSMLSSTRNPSKFSRNFSFNCCQEYMHFGGNLAYQFVVASSREMMSDLARVASSPPAGVMAAL